ncbi:AraC family transcriptional regulator, arabinose operon regulatory protein [Paenibacillus sophorae]|uniref:AraC family transcriptional regulator n=1 Tax=Paenibacillus sophorae TaxID=1333845 RepID=A0A1H8K1Z0_9BACL|nr:AraC family transcriptional regulator [Paenibacillus sophorae]QWU13557.1 AraC family transcriptional regulator [Paenibacillus sophorae]SEN86566.1 AraC family transcriptional regulator, arabinose operon regulatory protein [Paenibacillus sophorae]
MTSDAPCTILTAGFSFHHKPFQMSEAEGFPHYLIRLQTEGGCSALIDGEITRVESGGLMLIAPGVPYNLIIDKEKYPLGEPRVESGDYHIFCRGEWIDRWWNSRLRPSLMHIPLNDALIGLFRQLVLEQRRLSDFSPEISSCYLQILCMEIDRLTVDRPSVSTRGYLAYRMKQFVEENAALSFHLEDVADYVGISVSRAVHLFKEAFGTTIVKYVNEVRLEMARERIVYSPMPLEHIAEACGFVNYTYFHRQFRKRYGMSPKQFRTHSREMDAPALM